MNCIACKSEIPEGASLCFQCDSFQLPWKNRLKFGATVVGIFVVLASLLTYILSNADVIRKSFFWHDKIMVLSVDSVRHVALSNPGDGDVFVSHLQFRVKTEIARRTNQRLIGEVLKAGSIADYKFKDNMEARIGWVVPYGKIDREMLRRAHIDQERTCFSFEVMGTEDPSFQHLKGDYKDQLETFPAEAYVEFYSPKTQKITRENISVVGILAQNLKCALGER